MDKKLDNTNRYSFILSCSNNNNIIIIIHPLLLQLYSSVKIGFMDDLTLSGELHTVERDITTIKESSSETGLQLNMDKCEIITDDFTEISTLATFNDFIRVNK